jgi:hypothetical protein
MVPDVLQILGDLVISWVRTIVNWFWAVSPILVPSLVIAGLWRSWSHAGDFTLTRADKLLRTAVFVVLVAAFVALMLSIFAPHDKYGSLDWNEI